MRNFFTDLFAGYRRSFWVVVAILFATLIATVYVPISFLTEIGIGGGVGILLDLVVNWNYVRKVREYTKVAAANGVSTEDEVRARILRGRDLSDQLSFGRG